MNEYKFSSEALIVGGVARIAAYGVWGSNQTLPLFVITAVEDCAGLKVIEVLKALRSRKLRVASKAGNVWIHIIEAVQ